MSAGRVVSFSSRHRRSLLLLLSLAVGTLYAAWIVGFRELDPRDISWIRADAVTNYLGWAFMRTDPITALPLTWTDRIGYPLTLSVAHFDIIPGLAILLLPLSRVLPVDFQYLGPFQCLGAAALFYLGHELSRIHAESELVALASGVIVMTNSVFTLRLGSHAALTAQLFVLFPLYESLRSFGPSVEAGAARTRRGPRAGLVRVLAIVILAAAVNPYLAAMSAALALGYSAQLLLSDRGSARFVLATLLAGGCALALSAWFFGYLRGGDGNSGPGFGLYTANLDTFLNPLAFSRFFRGLPLAGPEQMEGASYLGVGVGALIVVQCVALKVSRPYRSQMALQVPMLVAGLAAFVFALSHRVTLGESTLLTLPLPERVLAVCAVFRTSGRFAWPLFYWLVTTSVSSLGLVLPRNARALCATAVAAVQLMELTPLRQGVRAAIAFSGEAPTPLHTQAFQRLGEAHRHLVVLPAWQCGPELSPGGRGGYPTLGLLAARQHMTINSYYSGRYSARVLGYHCRVLPATVLRDGPAPDTAYVVDAAFLAWFQGNARTSHECGDRDGFHLCVRRGTLY